MANQNQILSEQSQESHPTESSSLDEASHVSLQSKTVKLFLLPSIILLSLSSSFGIDQIDFPAEKNKVQIFPQSFEYLLVNQKSFQIGDTMIDTDNFKLSVRTTKDKERIRFFFEWPADFIREGELLLQDTAGKNIWSEKINSQRVKIDSNLKKPAPEGIKPVRSSSSNLLSNTLDSDLVDKLKSLAYFKFCIRFEENGTRIYLCSSDFFLNQTSNGLIVQKHDALQKESFVEINGKVVDPQGLIFLSEVTDNISLRVLLESGSRIEVDTHRREVKFKDFTLAEDEKSIIVKAEGAQPANRIQVLSEESDSWRAKINLDRPILYLKGEGNIPLKQEFVVEGKLRKESDQIQVKSKANKKTYSSQETLELKATKDLKIFNKEKKSVLTKNYQWTLLDLEKGALNTRYLDVDSKEGRFVGSFDVYRGYPYELSARLMLPLFIQTQATLNLDINNSFQASYQRLLNASSSDNDFSTLEASYSFNFKPGIRQLDPIWGGGFFANQLQLGTNTTTLLGLNLHASMKSDITSLIRWINMKLELPLLQMSSSYSLKTSYSFEIAAKRELNENTFIEAGLQVFSYSLSNDTQDLKSSKNLLFLGLDYRL